MPIAADSNWSVPVAAGWLADAFAARGGGVPTLLRNVAAAVWTDGRLVAKVHTAADEAHREQLVAARFAEGGCPVVQPVGVQDCGIPDAWVRWWAWIDIDGPASPREAARWLRSAHDAVTTRGLPRARWLANEHPVHPDAADLHLALEPWRRRAL